MSTENIKILEGQKRRLINEFNWLLFEFNEYKQLISSSTSFEEAENKYYSQKFNESGHDSHYEGYFYSFEYKSLSKKIKENKEKRNELTIKIRELKHQIKNLHKKYSLAC